jgi:hypothetical protein
MESEKDIEPDGYFSNRHRSVFVLPLAVHFMESKRSAMKRAPDNKSP